MADPGIPGPIGLKPRFSEPRIRDFSSCKCPAPVVTFLLGFVSYFRNWPRCRVTQRCQASGWYPAVGRPHLVERVDLRRYEITGRLGSGADYDVRAAIDRETGAEVALKRPVPSSREPQAARGHRGAH